MSLPGMLICTNRHVENNAPGGPEDCNGGITNINNKQNLKAERKSI